MILPNLAHFLDSFADIVRLAAGRLTLDHWDDAVEQWILRVNFLVTFRPDLALPEIGEKE